MKNLVMVGPDKQAIPVQRCFELVSSHQQGIRVHIHSVDLYRYESSGEHVHVYAYMWRFSVRETIFQLTLDMDNLSAKMNLS